MKSFMLCSSRRLALLLGLMVCLFMTWCGFRIWDNLTRSDPVRLIHFGSVSERRQAAYDLHVVAEDTDIERVMAALVRASEDRDVEVRAAAAASLSALASEIVRRPDRTPAEQGSTKRRLNVATRALAKGLSDPEPKVRASVVRGFGELGKSGKVALPPELFAALNDETSSVRQATFKALGAVQLTPAAVPNLIEALGSRDREDRFHAAWLLGRLGPEAKSAVPALLPLLKEPFDLQERKTTRLVGSTGDPACTAARALGQIGASEEGIAILAEMLSSDVPERVSCAALGLRDLGPRAIAAVPKLVAAYDKLLKSKQHVIGQMSISDAIGWIAAKSTSAPDAIAILVRALESGDEWIRRGAVEALGRFGEDAAAAIPKLRSLEQDPAKDVRVAASAAVVAIEAASVGSPTVRSVNPER
jgi:HEAT repeat protein